MLRSFCQPCGNQGVLCHVIATWVGTSKGSNQAIKGPWSLGNTVEGDSGYSNYSIFYLT